MSESGTTTHTAEDDTTSTDGKTEAETLVPSAQTDQGLTPTHSASTPASTGELMADFGADGPNPLRDPADRRLPRVPEPCALVIFGIGGDLSRKKLIAAIYDLANRGLLPTDFVLVGFSRSDWPGGGSFEAMARPSAR